MTVPWQQYWGPCQLPCKGSKRRQGPSPAPPGAYVPGVFMGANNPRAPSLRPSPNRRELGLLSQWFSNLRVRKHRGAGLPRKPAVHTGGPPFLVSFFLSTQEENGQGTSEFDGHWPYAFVTPLWAQAEVSTLTAKAWADRPLPVAKSPIHLHLALRNNVQGALSFVRDASLSGTQRAAWCRG